MPRQQSNDQARTALVIELHNRIYPSLGRRYVVDKSLNFSPRGRWRPEWALSTELREAYQFELREKRRAIRAAATSALGQQATSDGWSLSIIRITFYPLMSSGEIGAVLDRRKVWPLSALEQLASVAK